MFNFFDKKDSKIQEDVMSELKWDPSVTSTQINASVVDGIVTLRGTVPHFFEKANAEEAAQRVGGVRAVTDEIEVDLLNIYEKSDVEIAEAALSALSRQHDSPNDIKVTVAKGWITLSGQLDWDFQRISAKDSVRQLTGVRGVSNNITLKSRALVSEVKNQIEDALKRSATAEGRKISVTVNGNKVTLTGTVHSRAEMSAASKATWNAPGVMEVHNELVIGQ